MARRRQHPPASHSPPAGGPPGPALPPLPGPGSRGCAWAPWGPGEDLAGSPQGFPGHPLSLSVPSSHALPALGPRVPWLGSPGQRMALLRPVPAGPLVSQLSPPKAPAPIALPPPPQRPRLFRAWRSAPSPSLLRALPSAPPASCLPASLGAPVSGLPRLPAWHALPPAPSRLPRTQALRCLRAPV